MSRLSFLRLWLLICAVAIGLLLGSTPLLDADEGRNGEVGREMAATNDYVLPHLNALPYLDKPIVYFAAEAAAMEVLGSNELAARLPAYLFTLATAALLFWFARRVWGGEQAQVAAIVYLAMPLTIAFARTVIFDSALTFFIVAAIVAFYFAIETRQRRWAVLAWTAMGLGVLTKGPVAIVVPLFIAIPYSVWRKAFGTLWSLLGLVLFAAVIAPWVWGVSQTIPNFLRYVLVTETAARLATDELKRTGPPWYFLPYLIGGALPWSVVALASWREWKRREPAVIYVLLWVVVPFVFFSLSQSKRPQYILPLMPAVALLVAASWRSIRMRSAGVVSALLGAILVAAPFVPQLFRKMEPGLTPSARLVGWILGALFLAGGLVAVFAKKREIVLVALSIPVIAIPLVSTPLMVALGERRSAHGMAMELAPHLTPDTEIIGVEAFTGSMAFYLRRPVILASDDASEFTSNYLIRNYSRFSGIPGSPLKPLSWFRADLDQCCRPRIYIVRIKDGEFREILEARGLRVIADSAHHLAYGPFTGPNTMPRQLVAPHSP